MLPELKAAYANNKIKISTELYKKGCVRTPEEGLAAAHRIGFPVMIKASEGGGGKGIRKAEGPEEFPSLFRQVLAAVSLEIYRFPRVVNCMLARHHRMCQLILVLFMK
jgi:biotin carboxylase